MNNKCGNGAAGLRPVGTEMGMGEWHSSGFREMLLSARASIPLVSCLL